MPTTVEESNVYTQLRDRAEARLRAGATPAAGHWSMGIDALSLLHRLSSQPDRADDALKLLHELQVHQVELDLQNEEVSANERATEQDLGIYRALYESAPFGYCVVNVEGSVIKGNAAAAALFGTGSEPLEGQRLDGFLNSQTRPLLKDLLSRVATNGARSSCVVQLGGKPEGAGNLQFVASMPPEGEHILLACFECEPTQ